jgi:hypothetical protein
VEPAEGYHTGLLAVQTVGSGWARKLGQDMALLTAEEQPDA